MVLVQNFFFLILLEWSSTCRKTFERSLTKQQLTGTTGVIREILSMS